MRVRRCERYVTLIEVRSLFAIKGKSLNLGSLGNQLPNLAC